ncbi:hypothetical protein AMTR_s00071p00056450 [Amborella trichopoda]|uniref:Uncharacterized protein n=1 Tax=Amborella trichopoda TaxID=13333 RepID=U5DBH5_AMBTC|nr:hypothetical protein AMTR_s00071p00056450 [Amborella trichopoda]
MVYMMPRTPVFSFVFPSKTEGLSAEALSFQFFIPLSSSRASMSMYLGIDPHRFLLKRRCRFICRGRCLFRHWT